MGMYTELVLKAEVKDDAPESVKAILGFLFNGEDRPTVTPEHPFFSCERWSMIGRCSSYYHVPWNASAYREAYIFSRSDLKNYEGEIEKFLDWVRPYFVQESDQCIGWSWYEESESPTLIYGAKP